MKKIIFLSIVVILFLRSIYAADRGWDWDKRDYYDNFGNYLMTGYKVYELVDYNQEEDGRSWIYKNRRFENWFRNFILFKDGMDGYYTRIAIGDTIPVKFSSFSLYQTAMNGIRFDFGYEKDFHIDLIYSRLSHQIWLGWSANYDKTETEDYSYYMLGAETSFNLFDNSELSLYYANIHQEYHQLKENIIYGAVDTSASPTELYIKFLDDDEEDNNTGSALYGIEVYADDAKIGSIYNGEFSKSFFDNGYLVEESGDVEVTTEYRKVQGDGYWVYKFKLTSSQVSDAKEIKVRVKIAGDYRILVKSDLDSDYTEIRRAMEKGESKAEWISFNYGVETGIGVLGATYMTKILGFNIIGEVDLNYKYYKLPSSGGEIFSEPRLAYYGIISREIEKNVTATIEYHSVDYDYTTFYKSKDNVMYYLVDDNDDKDGYKDSEDPDGVIPGYDKNQNSIADYNDDFLKLKIDPPFFMVAADRNNNTILDFMENDSYPDYKYKADRVGYSLSLIYFDPVDNLNMKVVYDRNKKYSDGALAKSLWTLIGYKNYIWGIGIVQIKGYLKRVKDMIPDDILTEDQKNVVTDKLLEQDNFVADFLSDLMLDIIKGLTLNTKFKYSYNLRYFDNNSKIYGAGFIGRLEYKEFIISKLQINPIIKFIAQKIYCSPSWVVEESKNYSKIGGFMVDYFFTKNTSLGIGFEYDDYDDFLLENNSSIRRALGIQLLSKAEYKRHPIIFNAGFKSVRQNYKTSVKEKIENDTVFVKVFTRW